LTWGFGRGSPGFRRHRVGRRHVGRSDRRTAESGRRRSGHRSCRPGPGGTDGRRAAVPCPGTGGRRRPGAGGRRGGRAGPSARRPAGHHRGNGTAGRRREACGPASRRSRGTGRHWAGRNHAGSHPHRRCRTGAAVRSVRAQRRCPAPTPDPPARRHIFRWLSR
jgi:hypothetical protein